MTPIRVVLDTNCLVSALIFPHGKAGRLRFAWQQGEIIPLVCRETITELIRVLGYPKFSLTRQEVEKLLADLLPWVEIVEIDFDPDTMIESLQDRDDMIFIRLAQVTSAFFLVSGDRHLLGLRDMFHDIHIVSLAEFLEKTVSAPGKSRNRPPA